ncbi:putative mediator of RNA polymerase II transcription subunit 26 [Fopius arisanus]|uniref:Mediator of RNA polymerase II transcription subunit 26 n=1 Tax=Fopius arisanus TaxID=64838 RepID=A0A0C9RF83_9HYME|nr:PREDICTED: putative mediator of RNA polymerase II transcription subunit 26 [Fopius arisanus]
MNRRKVLEVSRKQKVLEKRASVAAFHPNSKTTAYPKSSEPSGPLPIEKAIQHDHPEVSPEFSETHRQPSGPKTKFTSIDRSSEFSPRLKNFPAEELRRFDASPRVETTLPPFQMTGDGDILHTPVVPQQIPQPMPKQSSHPEVFNVVPLERSPERQPHRPYVPKSLDHEERLISGHQSEGNFLKKRETEEMERQPVGGKNTVMSSQHISQADHHHSPENHVQFAGVQEIPQEIYYQQFPGLGMTSPQDVLINRSRMSQQQVYHQNFNKLHQHHQVVRQADHNKNYSPVTHPHQQSAQQFRQREFPRQRGPENEKSFKALEFTPEMIQDQEKLVGILRQQGFPDEIIKRQFDGLLAEQQRQLLFLHQLDNPDSSSQHSKNTEQPRRKRITKLDKDEKPEWMMHITPPWVSHATLEEMDKSDGQMRQQDQEDLRYKKNHENQTQQQNLTQIINPVFYEQQQQQTEYNYHPHHTQQISNFPQYHPHHQPLHPNNPDAVPQQLPTLESQNHQEVINYDRKSRVEPSSLMKLKTYKDVIKRQKQNNGLQDAATIKEAMEALKNPVNRKGLEYLDNLEKREKQIKLNGTQEPEEGLFQNWPHRPPDYFLQQSQREARANGLENRRNPDNPPPPIIIQQRSMNESMPVYPRRIEGDEFYGMQSTLADGIPQNCASALRNIGDPAQGYKNHFQAHVNNQVQGGTSGSNQGMGAGKSFQPFDMHQRQEYFQEMPKSCLKEGQCCVREYFEEPRIIGGVKYIGRKPEFIPNSYYSGPHN